MSVYLRNATRGSGIDARALVRTVERLLAAAGETGSSVSLSIVRDRAMRTLNREYRGRDAPTDVLSFPLAEATDAPETERLLGDIVISLDTARRQAADYDAPLERELERLTIHGLLHLLGHDHEEADERDVMIAQERRLADAIGMPWPY